MGRKKVFVSFDWHNDKHYKFLLDAWHQNPEFEFEYFDVTPGEINSTNVERIKAGLSVKIRDASHTLFIVGKHANSPHALARSIGFINWINFEAYQSNYERNKLCVVKIEDSNALPNELLSVRYSWITGFTEANVIAVLNHST